jgi:hypothetical protein
MVKSRTTQGWPSRLPAPLQGSRSLARYKIPGLATVLVWFSSEHSDAKDARIGKAVPSAQ